MVARMIITPEISRLAKAIVDAGKCSFPEAERRLNAARIVIHVDPKSAGEPAAQAAALTAVVTAVRCFLGGVWITGATECPLILPMRSETLGGAAVRLGARMGAPPAARTIVIGGDRTRAAGCALRAWWDDWSAGVRPLYDRTPLGNGRNSLAGIAAGALAVGQAFLAECGDNQAGRVVQVVSLWSPGSAEVGPQRFSLPDALWLIGLGNLGQSFVWSLAMLPYRHGRDLQLVLQDEDIIRDVNWSTSILVLRRRYGMLKTKVVEDWAVRRGFRVRRIDRFMDSATLRRPHDPPIAMSGLDRIAARRFLDDLGFERVIDCGLGATAKDYGRFRLNVFDRNYAASTHFAGVEDQTDRNGIIQLPAYQDEITKGHEMACGMAELAGASVAAPFVSALVGALAVTQAIKISSGESHARAIVGTIDRVDSLRVVDAQTGRPARVGYVTPR
jgi:hypothetical protein